MQSKTSPCVELGLAAIALPGQPQCFISGLGSCPLLLVRAVNFIACRFLGLDPVPHTYLYDHHGHPVLHSLLLPSPGQERANESSPKARVGVSAFRIVFHGACQT